MFCEWFIATIRTCAPLHRTAVPMLAKKNTNISSHECVGLFAPVYGGDISATQYYNTCRAVITGGGAFGNDWKSSGEARTMRRE